MLWLFCIHPRDIPPYYQYPIGLLYIVHLYTYIASLYPFIHFWLNAKLHLYFLCAMTIKMNQIYSDQLTHYSPHCNHSAVNMKLRFLTLMNHHHCVILNFHITKRRSIALWDFSRKRCACCGHYFSFHCGKFWGHYIEVGEWFPLVHASPALGEFFSSGNHLTTPHKLAYYNQFVVFSSQFTFPDCCNPVYNLQI